MLKMYLLLGLLATTAGCAQAESRPEFARIPPESWTELDLAGCRGACGLSLPTRRKNFAISRKSLSLTRESACLSS